MVIYAVLGLLDPVQWTLNGVLRREGVSMLQWAFMRRALDRPDGVPFREIMQATAESKDNVRRAASGLRGCAEVVAEPRDRRARRLVLTKHGRKLTRNILKQYERELMTRVGASQRFSQRAEQFSELLWKASAYLKPLDTADHKAVLRSKKNRKLIPDNSSKFVEENLDALWNGEEVRPGEPPF